MMSTYTKNAIVLGLLAAIGPFAIDMYIPALPTIAADLHASTQATQMTLMVFFVSFGVCQIVYGPLSDMFGRKRPLYFGLALYILGAAGCVFAPSVETLIAFRVLQGIGASAVMVIPRAIIRDLYTGIEATKLMSLVMLVLSVAPILAPLAGSGLIVPFGWRAVFVAMTIVGALGLILVLRGLPETRPASQRISAGFGSAFAGFGRLLRNGHFMGLTFIGGFGMSSFFVYLASSSFIYIDHFGLTPTQFSFAFSVNAIAFIGTSQFAATLGGRFGMARVVRAAVAGFAFFTLVLLALTLAGIDNLFVLIALLFCANAPLGLIIPTCMVLALEDHGPIAGMASALGGTLQMVFGAIMIVVVSLLFDGTALPMVGMIALAATGALILGLITLRGRVIAQPAQ